MNLRTDLDPQITSIADELATPSELAYAVGKMCDEAIIDQLGDTTTIATVIGVLEAVKLDFYQRHAVPLTIEDLHGEN